MPNKREIIEKSKKATLNTFSNTNLVVQWWLLPIKEKVSKEAAEDIKKQLEELGAQVEVK